MNFLGKRGYFLFGNFIKFNNLWFLSFTTAGNFICFFEFFTESGDAFLVCIHDSRVS